MNAIERQTSLLQKIKKVLIANRGEIALRIIRTCKDLGIETVAIYSEADEQSLHVKLADEAVCIGPPPAKNSYLNIPSIMPAAEVTGADAIHPGYGFLSENTEFSRICRECDIIFIGPSPECINLLGDKVQSREIALKAGIPVSAGTQGALKNLKHAIEEAKRIGFPVMLKARAGGGGRGITIIRREEDLLSSYEKCSSEAEAAFGNGGLFLEKFFENPRHVEIQVAADVEGKALYFGERDCTVQRRHQKIIEEAPCSVISEEVRIRMGESAVQLIKQIGYENIGTVEFLLDSDRESFYFLEMNTRIQVEHPVTEMVTGIDFVKLQLEIADEKRMRFDQKDIHVKGHAIECRINAEDPSTFMPSPGAVEELHVPGGLGVRFDSFIYEGYTVPHYYDSMIGKLISHEENRDFAIRKMLRCLEELNIEGIKTNIPFQKQILQSSKFKKNSYGTSFLEEFFSNK